MRRTTTVTAVLFAVLLAGGCSSGGEDGKAEAKPAASTPTVEASPSQTAPPKLSVEWGPKLDAATDSGQPDVCKEVGSKGCVTHITKLTQLVYDVRDAIDTAGATPVYPKTVEAIGDVEDASGAYAEGGCQGSTEATLDEGSVCGGYVATLLLGPATLSMTMATDEVTAS